MYQVLWVDPAFAAQEGAPLAPSLPHVRRSTFSIVEKSQPPLGSPSKKKRERECVCVCVCACVCVSTHGHCFGVGGNIWCVWSSSLVRSLRLAMRACVRACVRACERVSDPVWNVDGRRPVVGATLAAGVGRQGSEAACISCCESDLQVAVPPAQVQAYLASASHPHPTLLHSSAR
jgi:hypothetical protein